MKTKSRSKNSIQNAVVTLLYQIIILVVGLFVPRLIVSTFGSEVNGLTTNINQVIDIINLLQAGLVGASIYEMFKPISENDYDTVSRIYSSTKKYYNRLSYLFFALSLLIIPYILFSQKNSLETLDVVFAVVFSGITGTIIFRYYSNYDAIFSAHQKRYILIISLFAEKIVYYILLFVVLFFKFHYVLMYLSALIGSIFRILFLRLCFKKYFSGIIVFNKTSTYKVKNQYSLFGNQVIQHALEMAPTIVVTLFFGLKYASVISIYLIVINVFKTIFSTIQNSVAPSFGDLSVSSDKEKVKEVFSAIQLIFAFISSVLLPTVLLLLTSFVALYTKNVTDVNYVYPLLSVILVYYLASFSSFLPCNMFINSQGKYGIVLKTNIINGALSLLLIVFLPLVGFELVYVGLLLFYLVSFVHRILVINKVNDCIGIKNFLLTIVPFLFLCCASPFLSFVPAYIVDWKTWIVVGCIVGGCSLLSSIAFAFLFFRKESRAILSFLGKK